jgi:hypothetical protein
MMQTLQSILANDARVRADSRLQEQDFRNILAVAAPIFKEQRLAPEVFPMTVQNDPGVLESAHLEIIDVGDAHHGMSGTDGTWDRASKKLVKETAYAIWANLDVPWREALSARRGGFDILRESAQAASETIAQTENKMTIGAGLGPVVGLTSRTGIQTFAGAAWTNTGVAWDNLITAIDDKMRTENVPKGSEALLVNPAEMAKLRKKLVATANFGVDFAEVEALFPGGVHVAKDCPAGKAYVYAKTPTVMEYRVYQDLTVVPLPKVDEGERVRVRVIGALHVKKVKGVVEITGIA